MIRPTAVATKTKVVFIPKPDQNTFSSVASDKARTGPSGFNIHH